MWNNAQTKWKQWLIVTEIDRIWLLPKKLRLNLNNCKKNKRNSDFFKLPTISFEIFFQCKVFFYTQTRLFICYCFSNFDFQKTRNFKIHFGRHSSQLDNNKRTKSVTSQPLSQSVAAFHLPQNFSVPQYATKTT